MSELDVSSSPVDLFYRKLIKSPLTLSSRNELGAILASVIRAIDKEKWSDIASSNTSFSKPLSFLREHGYLPLEIPYANQLVAELLSIKSPEVYDNGPGGRKETITLQGVSSLPLVQKLMQDISLHKLVSLYLGAPAYLHTTQAWWQLPMGPDHVPSNAQLWHRDRDDLSELKLFFYGTDVDASSGPHAFLPKSHTHEGLSVLFPQEALLNPIINGSSNMFVEDSFLRQQGLLSDFKTWLGPSGTCFLEDTRGFHRAYVPTKSPRLLLSLVWTVGPGF
jgi:hypothetical protein